jgi:hypothetical protein
MQARHEAHIKSKHHHIMATRATYSITNNMGVTAHLYIHWDGYETGAAAYFYQALTNAAAAAGNGGLAEQMLRAISGAELTSRPEQHGDTEFHYDIASDMSLKAFAIRRDENGERKKVPVFVGDIYSFINRYNELIEDFKPFKPVTAKYSTKSTWMNSVTAKNMIESRYGDLSHLRVWSQSSSVSRESGNWKSCTESLSRLMIDFPELITEEIQGFLD